MTGQGDQQPELASLETISAHVEKQLDLQWEHWDIVDGRLRLLLGFVGAVFVAILALVSNRAGELAGATVGLVVASTILLMLCALLTGLAWLPREFDRPPKPAHLRQGYLGRPAEQTMLAVVDAMVEAYNGNERKIDEKLGAFRRAGYLLALAVSLLAIGAILELVK
jgi:hypothetical protein